MFSRKLSPTPNLFLCFLGKNVTPERIFLTLFKIKHRYCQDYSCRCVVTVVVVAVVVVVKDVVVVCIIT